MPMMVIREQDRGDEMAERQPPAGEHEPDQIAGKAEQAGANIRTAGIFVRATLPSGRTATAYRTRC